MKYIIRNAVLDDLEEIAQVEALCFPAAEAAGKEAFFNRIKTFSDSFFVAEDTETGTIIGFINGAVVHEKTICDEMFEDAGWHKKDGPYQSVFGLDVIPQRRKQGVAFALMERLIEDARQRGRKGLILTCKERLIPYYEKFGYRSLGISESVHGGAVWYDMILELNQ